MNGYVKDLPEEQRLENILKSCDEHPDNEWWANLKVSAQARLDELYDLQYGVLLRESMDFHREQEELLITM